MRIGYVLNSYPMTSTTFIRREIEALEAQGFEVKRYAVRRWTGGDLVDARDRAEAERTRYLLERGAARLAGALAAETLTNPRGVLRALGLWRRLVANAGGGLTRHVAYLLEAAALKRQAMRDGARHLHAHFSTNAAAVAMLAEAMGGPAFSFTAHGPDEFRDPAAGSLGLKIERAAFVAAISQFCRASLALSGGMEVWPKLRIVRCGVDVDAFAVTGAPFDGVGEIVSVGRLCVQKAQSLIPEAVAAVVAEHPELRVVLIGDGELRPLVEREIAARGLQGRIELLGWRDNEEVRARVGRARAFLLPSFAEGLPVVLMEALALGRPVITTSIAGAPELVDARCGWITPAGDTAALAAALRAALEADGETLAAMGREGRARVEAMHDQKANAGALGALIRTCVENGGRLP